MYKSIVCVLWLLLAIGCQPKPVSHQLGAPISPEETDRLWRQTCANPKFGCISGHVRDKTGNPPGSQLTLYLVPSQLPPNWNLPLLSPLNEEGGYRIGNAPVGDGVLEMEVPDSASPGGKRVVQVPVRIVAGQISVVDIDLDIVVPTLTPSPQRTPGTSQPAID